MNIRFGRLGALLVVLALITSACGDAVPVPMVTPVATSAQQATPSESVPTPTPLVPTATPIPPTPTVAQPTPTVAPTSTPTPVLTLTPTAVTPTAGATIIPTTTPAANRSHRFVASSKAKKYYYCDTDPAWKDLSPANLVWYDSEAAAKAANPKLVLHAPCQ